jgi:hypothetical protein
MQKYSNRVKKSKYLFIVSIIACIHIAYAESRNPCIDWPNADFQPIANAQTKMVAPDYGIYWLKVSAGKFPEEVKKAYTPKTLEPQFADGTINQNPSIAQATTYWSTKNSYDKQLEQEGYFDPSKPTLFFIHGWQPGTVEKKVRFDLCYQYKKTSKTYSDVYNILQYWKNHGWNVGIFYWNQFADEYYIPTIESKLYKQANNEEPRWRYINAAGKVNYCSSSSSKTCMALPRDQNGQASSVNELAYIAYLNAFPQGYHQKVKVVGFSLGTQIAIQLTDLLLHNQDAVQPSQLVLLDPFFSIRRASGVPENIYEINEHTLLDIVNTSEKLDHGKLFPISMYRGSGLSALAYLAFIKNPAINRYIAYTRFYPHYLADSGLALPKGQHLATAYLYLQSINVQPIIQCQGKDKCSSGSYLTAAANENQISLMQGLQRFQIPAGSDALHDISEHDFPHASEHLFSSQQGNQSN